ncbi:hypothetical protein EGT74_00305 [Chitinophaga lutea]|uniref:Right-handed parallel beta-helix repeat-containing protein n=1 Tax=Chitinophaga lutea TaxID=2488634 RepID=A0A3N4PT74_9BACT|nr:hypothetical protein [Chitinophaga lutea]RPE12033.1 hypothetical protein EGT74_00305 [Chitinophaga lutea]
MKIVLQTILTFAVTGLVYCKKPEVKPSEQPQGQRSESPAALLSTTTFNVSPSTSFNSTFWSNVQAALATGPVDIIFADGTYTRTATLSLSNIGDDTNLLTLKTAVTEGGAVFNGSIAKLMNVNLCKNIKLLRLKFTGDVTGYALTIVNSQDITVEKCQFVNLPAVSYGALGVHYAASNRIIVKYNTFENVGYDSHAHMIYGAYGIQRLSVVANTFKDCSGSFVRFRGDLSDKGVVYDNDFISTGTYLTGINPVFIEVPVFNDVNPGNERMGTSFMITKNTFNYATAGSQATRYALVFHHTGFNPVDRNYLISAADATTLNSGTVTQKRNIMSTQLGLDGDSIHFGGNTNTNVQYNVVYRCWNGYGSTGPWTGIASIGTAVNATGLATTEAAAIGYYP